jgi:hypothetical protein
MEIRLKIARSRKVTSAEKQAISLKRMLMFFEHPRNGKGYNQAGCLVSVGYVWEITHTMTQSHRMSIQNKD